MLRIGQAGLAVLLACSAGATEQQFRRSYALAPGGHVTIENFYGNVQIQGWDRHEVRIEAVKTAADTRRLEQAQIVVDSTLDRLFIRTRYPGGDVDQPASVEYRITV